MAASHATLSIALFLLSLSAAPKVEVRPAPIFLVLRTASSPAQVKREARLHDEVSLLKAAEERLAGLGSHLEGRLLFKLTGPPQLAFAAV